MPQAAVDLVRSQRFRRRRFSGEEGTFMFVPPIDAETFSPNSTGSPIDTTGSISDSFYINSDVISSTNGNTSAASADALSCVLMYGGLGSQIADENACTESEVQSKYQLHR